MFRSLFRSKQSSEDRLLEVKRGFWERLSLIISPSKHRSINETLADLEEVLISMDLGIAASEDIINKVKQELSNIGPSISEELLSEILQAEFLKILPENLLQLEASPIKPYIMLVVGVNGVGKTTTIGKLAFRYIKNTGKKVLIGAADTFRAAAADQLKHWAEKAGAEFVSGREGADPSSVVYDSVRKGLELGADLILIDTAGRLHTKLGLMDELAKLRRTVQKLVPSAPHEVLLVIDGTTGQNAFNQAEAFIKSTAVSSLAITKLDGTTKGGVVVGVANRFKLPIRCIGVGEGGGDLINFDRDAFVEMLFSK